MDKINLTSTIFMFSGGLALFLYGMKQMSDGLQKSAGKKLKNVLDTLTGNRIAGASFGIVVTSIVQSSSAVTVMVVGFVNAGLMNLVQGLSIVLGANVGTTVTAQLLAFKISSLSLPFLTIGIFIIMAAKKPQHKYIGEILFGFGLLFFGLDMMKDAFAPLQHSASVKQVIVDYSSNVFLAAAIGALVTVILQSSSAVIGIVIALAISGSISYTAGCALVMGSNIGTTVTANIAAIGASKTAKQTAFGHFLFNFLGLYMLFILDQLAWLSDILTAGDPDFIAPDGTKPHLARHLANFHTIFNIINFFIFLPLLGYIAKISQFVIRSFSEEVYKTAKLSDSMLGTPAIAVSQCRKEVLRMAGVAEEMMYKAKLALSEKSVEHINRVVELEQQADSFKFELSTFLAKLFKKDFSLYSGEVDIMLKTINDLEKIADHSENIAKFTQMMVKNEMVVSKSAEKKLIRLFEVTENFYKMVLNAFEHPAKANSINRSLEDLIDEKQNRFKAENIQHLTKGDSPVNTLLAYIDIAHNLEKIGDHLDNIAGYLQSKHH